MSRKCNKSKPRSPELFMLKATPSLTVLSTLKTNHTVNVLERNGLTFSQKKLDEPLLFWKQILKRFAIKNLTSPTKITNVLKRYSIHYTSTIGNSVANHPAQKTCTLQGFCTHRHHQVRQKWFFLDF